MDVIVLITEDTIILENGPKLIYYILDKTPCGSGNKHIDFFNVSSNCDKDVCLFLSYR